MAATIELGTIVRCPHRIDGRIAGVRKGIVLREFLPGSSTCTPGDRKNSYMVWFYGQDGPATWDAISTARHGEITVVGALESLSERVLRRIDIGLGRGAQCQAMEVRIQASELRSRMRSERRAR